MVRKKPPKLPRILVEWECSECDQIHRISFPCVMKSLMAGIRVKWGKKENIKKLEIDYGISLSKLNEFLNSTFYERFHAINYVKISYPERLLNLLGRNEEIDQKFRLSENQDF